MGFGEQFHLESLGYHTVCPLKLPFSLGKLYRFDRGFMAIFSPAIPTRGLLVLLLIFLDQQLLQHRSAVVTDGCSHILVDSLQHMHEENDIMEMRCCSSVDD